jgi:hypothetical protein
LWWEGEAVGTKLKEAQASKGTLDAVAAFAQALDNGQISKGDAVPGFANLPPKVQAAVKDMGSAELRALRDLDKALRQDGVLVETDSDSGSVSLTMF